MLTAAQKTRVVFVIMGFLLVTAFLWGRLVFLQIVQPRHWISVAHRQQFQIVEIPPIRGAILDRRLKPLAISLRLASVFADPRHIKDPVAVARRLAPLLRRPIPEVEAQLRRKDRGFVWLGRRIPNQAAAQIRSMRLPGIHFCMEPKRAYPHGTLASHVIGFSGMDAQGLEGLELAYDSLLKGEPGWRWMMQDARRRTFSAWETPMVPARDGLELVLTIDTTIQFIAEEALDRAYRQRGAQGGSIIVMDPMTGEILAMANRPTMDPNQYNDFPIEARRNRAITDTFEPGSVFKTITAAVALGTGRIDPSDTFYCEQGAFSVAGHVLNDVHPHGWLTFKEVIAQSSNIGTAKAAMRLGPDLLHQGIKAFGFGQPTGVGLPGEVGGTTKDPSQWSKPSMTAIPMGQEVTVTALQLAQAMGAVANGGLLVRPWIVKEIRHPSGALVKRFGPSVVRRVIERHVAGELTDILSAVVEQGTGKSAQVLGVSAAGKTGTGQKIEPTGGGYSHSRFVASFVGFVPADRPQLVIAVILDEPRPVYPFYFGGVAAAPVFREVATDVLAYLREQLQEDPIQVASSTAGGF